MDQARPLTRPIPELLLAAAPLLVPAVVLCAYWNVWNHALAWDDHWYIPSLPDLALADLPAMWQSPFVLSANYWRPLPLTLLWLEAQTGLGSSLHHLINLVLHLVNTSLVLMLANRLTATPDNPVDNRGRATIAALIYGLHPTLVESTAWISGRFDVLVTTFMLLALTQDWRLRTRPSRPFVVATLFLFAALSKEMAAIFLPVLILWQLATRTAPCKSWAEELAAARTRGDLRVLMWVIGAGLLYLALRSLALGHVLLHQESAFPLSHTFDRILLPAIAMAGYVRMAIVPFFSLSPQHIAEIPFSWAGQYAWLGIALCLLLVWYAIKATRTPAAKSATPWLILASAAALLPVLHLWPLRIGETFIAERFLAFPLALGALSLASMLTECRLARFRSTALAIGCGWIVAAFVSVLITVPHWQNNWRLWNWTNEVAPTSMLGRMNLIEMHKNRGMAEEGIHLIEAALARAKEEHIPELHADLGMLLMELGNYRRAEQALTKSIALFDDLPEHKRPAPTPDILGKPRIATDMRYVSVINLGIVREAMQQPAEAEQAYLLAILMAPNAVPGLYHLGRLAYEREQPARAAALLNKVVTLGETKQFRLGARQSDQHYIVDAEKLLRTITARARPGQITP